MVNAVRAVRRGSMLGLRFKQQQKKEKKKKKYCSFAHFVVMGRNQGQGGGKKKDRMLILPSISMNKDGLYMEL